MTFVNPAGGLRYHLRAARHSKSLWAPFRRSIGAWLTAWAPPERELVLVGPSAGYCLEPKALEHFGKLTCLEPDPLARKLFRRRFGRAHEVEFANENFFGKGDPRERVLAFRTFLRDRHAGAAVLFTNFLGQLTLIVDPKREAETLAAWKDGLATALAHCSWASFHDRVSGNLEPTFAPPLTASARLSDNELLERCYSAAPKGELTDHDTKDFFAPEREHAYFTWRLTPKQWHLIEATRNVR